MPVPLDRDVGGVRVILAVLLTLTVQEALAPLQLILQLLPLRLLLSSCPDPRLRLLALVLLLLQRLPMLLPVRFAVAPIPNVLSLLKTALVAVQRIS